MSLEGDPYWAGEIETWYWTAGVEVTLSREPLRHCDQGDLDRNVRITVGTSRVTLSTRIKQQTV